jgi:dihydrofolate reductase
MAKVLLDMAVSLDGFVGGPGGADVGLYDWYFKPSEVSRPVIDELIATTGAIVIGRGAYVTGEESGGWDDTPYALPHFVITHHPPPVSSGGVEFVFVTEGVAAAIDAAKKAAADRYATIGAVAISRGRPWPLGWSTSCSCTLSRCWWAMEFACSTASITDGSSPRSA